MKKTLLTIVMATLCLFLKVNAQTNTKLAGTVVSGTDHKLLAGATIKVKATGVTFKTNNKGAFIINTTEITGILQITYLGYKTAEVSFNAATIQPLIIRLDENSDVLNEVEINAGYYTVKDKERTGSISRITAETIGKQPITNPLQALQGTMPGIYVQQTSGVPGTNINVQIRGKSSIDAGNNPFYIIDGVPFTSQTLSSIYSSISTFGNAGSSPFNSLSSDDIESIEVLKDADATAIYGSRGANGVVLITTKKGRAGKTQVSINANSGFSKVTRMLDMMSTPEYIEMRMQGLENDGLEPSETDYDLNGTWNRDRETNWQKELIGGTSRIDNGSISLSGGNANTRFLMSGNYQKQGTVYPGDFNFRRLGAHFSVNHTSVNQKLKANFSVIYTGDENKLLDYELSDYALYLSPNAPALYTADGSINWENSTWINPIRETLKDFRTKNRTMSSNAVISYEIIKGLNIKANLGFNDNRLNDRNSTPSTYDLPAMGQSTAYAFSDFNISSQQSWIAEPQLVWDKDFKLGKLNILLGATLQNQQREQLVQRALGFTSDELLGNPQAATTLEVRDYQSSMYRYQAIFGRINYNYQGKYILNISGRRDGSSRFGPGKQYADFGAIGAAWLFSNEDFFMKYLAIIKSGKLRVSYGLSGNDQIGDYEYLDLYNSGGAYNGISGLTPIRLYNPAFGWEVNKKAELGLDLGFLEDRIQLSADYYYNRSSNQLVKYPLAATAGFTSIRNNLAATVQNSGFELEFNTVNLKGKYLSWRSSFNLTVPKNKLISFPGLAGSSYASKYVVGQSLNIRKIYHSLGVDPQSGLWIFEDVNHDGKITSAVDKQTIVNVGQKFYGGFSNTLSYKNLELSFLFQFVKQNAANFLAFSLAAPGTAAQPEAFKGKQWQKVGDIATIQRYTSGQNSDALNAYNNYIVSDAANTDASFIRLKNAQISYDFKDIISGTSSVKLYVQGQNLLTITNYFGLDPETTGFLPPLRTLTFGAQFTF